MSDDPVLISSDTSIDSSMAVDNIRAKAMTKTIGRRLVADIFGLAVFSLPILFKWREVKEVTILYEFKSKSNFIPHLNDERAFRDSFQIANMEFYFMTQKTILKDYC